MTIASEMAALWLRIDELVAVVEAGMLDVDTMSPEETADFIRAANRFVDDVAAISHSRIKRQRLLRDVPSE
jgi:hypothetical protein